MASSSPIPWLLLAPVAALAQAACFAPPGHQSGGRRGGEVRDTGATPADSAHPVEDEPDDFIDDEVEQVGGGGPHAGDGSVLALDDGPCGQPIDRLHAQAEGAAFLYAERPQGPRIFPLCLSLDAAALAALEEAPRDDVVATVQFGGRAWEVGLHLKGSPNGSMRPISEKASFKIDFHEWSSAARFYGVKRLTLNSMIQDPTMAAEHAAWRLYAAAGVPAARHGYIDLWLNGEPYGLMGVVETMDEQQLARLFPGRDDGNLYEGGYGADLISGRDDKFELKEEGGAATAGDLPALIQLIEDAPADGILDLLDAHFDRPALLRMWAVEIASSNIDAYSSLANNYFLYHPADGEPWVMLPWGPDQSFLKDKPPEVEVGVYDSPHGRLARGCRGDPACSAALDLALAEVLDLWEEIDLAAAVDHTTTRIEAACRADTRSNYGDYGCRDAQIAMRAWVRARPDIVRAALLAGPTP